MRRAVTELRPHPRNAEIYGDGVDDDFVRSVRDRGILVPLLVTGGGMVVAGHRRLAAARRAGLADVPVTVFDSEDEVDVLEALVHANKTRDKSKVQKAKEAEVLMEVERERAKRRQKEGQSTGGKARHGSMVEHVPPCSEGAGKARDKVGEALGVSGKTVEKMLTVKKEIDRLEGAGDAAAAAELTATLNESVGKAFASVTRNAEAVTDPPARTSEPTQPAAADGIDVAAMTETAAKFLAARRALADLRRKMTDLGNAPGGQRLRERLRKYGRGLLSCEELDQLATMLFNTQPFAVGCPNCGGKDPTCALCAGNNWLARGAWKNLPAKAQGGMTLIPQDDE